MSTRRTALAGLLALLACSTHAAEPAAPDQLVGIFIQGCLPFAGNPPALRDWAARNRLVPLPDAATRAFLRDAPGQSFDASAPGVKLVLASSDDGICAAITDRASADAVASALEAGFRQAGLSFRLAIDRDDTATKALHFREYLARRRGRSWRILAATVHDPAGGQAMLTAAPE